MTRRRRGASVPASRSRKRCCDDDATLDAYVVSKAAFGVIKRAPRRLDQLASSVAAQTLALSHREFYRFNNETLRHKAIPSRSTRLAKLINTFGATLLPNSPHKARQKQKGSALVNIAHFIRYAAQLRPVYKDVA